MDKYEVNRSGGRKMGRVAVPAGILAVLSVTVPVFVYVGWDLFRILTG